MQGGSVWLWLRRVLVGVVCVVAAVGAAWGLYAGLRYWRVEQAIGRFETAPSQARADVLVGLLDDNMATTKQAERALGLLVTPTVITRGSYPLGSCPVISVEQPFVLPFRMLSIGAAEQFLYDGGPTDWRPVGMRDSMRGLPRRRTIYPAPEKVGVYPIKLRQEYKVNLGEREHRWSWHPFSGPFPRSLLPRRHTVIRRFVSPKVRDYEYAITLRAEVVVVEAADAETVTLVSSGELDEGMRAAFRDIGATRSGNVPRRWAHAISRSTVYIRYENIPAAVGFEPVLCLDDGREIPSEGRASRRLRARAGTSGVFIVSPWILVSEESGPFSGVLELRADPEAAYEDPAIKEIWGGTLRFPITFSADESESPSPRSE